MTQPLYILNGPNLNRLGRREPEIYGRVTLDEIGDMCRKAAGELPVVFRQSNAEAQLFDWIHEATDEGAGLIINPAGYSFTSVAMMDALKMFNKPIIELNISNIHRREAIYHKSLMSGVVTAVIAGLGARGYPTAVTAICDIIKEEAGV